MVIFTRIMLTIPSSSLPPGMNLYSTHEESHRWFLGVTWTTVICMVLGYFGVVYLLFRAGVFLI